MSTQQITRAQVAQAFGAFEPITLAPIGEHTELLAPHVDLQLLAIYTAEALAWPVSSVKITHQVGRMAIVDYAPVQGYDPDLLLVLETSKAGAAFNRAVAMLQNIRRAPMVNPAKWYQQARQAAQALAGPLWVLQPAAAEADFVIRWALSVAAQGRVIQDGIPYYKQPERQQTFSSEGLWDSADAMARWG